jgi:hypothetical protein
MHEALVWLHQFLVSRHRESDNLASLETSPYRTLPAAAGASVVQIVMRSPIYFSKICRNSNT